jgi:hypothetical protein
VVLAGRKRATWGKPCGTGANTARQAQPHSRTIAGADMSDQSKIFRNHKGIEFEYERLSNNTIKLKRGGYSVIVDAFGLRKWSAGAMVQDAFHGMHADDREFLITGMTPEEQKQIYGD